MKATPGERAAGARPAKTAAPAIPARGPQAQAGGAAPSLSQGEQLNQRHRPEAGPAKPVGAKSVICFEENVRGFFQQVPFERVGFLTLTFADRVTDFKEASRRFHSFACNVLNRKFGKRWIRVSERTKRGCIHYHVLLDVGQDIRTGCDFERIARRDYGGAPEGLRALWAFLRDTLPEYDFGRHELLPIKTNVEAAARYCAKYLQKTERQPEDRGRRLWAVGKGIQRRANTRFVLVERGREFRQKARYLAEYLGKLEAYKRKHGPRWGYMLAGDSTIPAAVKRLPAMQGMVFDESGEFALLPIAGACYGYRRAPDIGPGFYRLAVGPDGERVAPLAELPF